MLFGPGLTRTIGMGEVKWGGGMGFVDIHDSNIPFGFEGVASALQVIVGDNLSLAGETDSNQYAHINDARGMFLSILNNGDENNPAKMNAAANAVAKALLTATYNGSPRDCNTTVVDVPGGKSKAVHCAQYNAVIHGPGLDFVDISHGGTGLNYSNQYSGSFPAMQDQGAAAFANNLTPKGEAYPGAISPATQKMLDAQIANYSKVACGAPGANNSLVYDPATGGVKANCQWFIPVPSTMTAYQAINNQSMLQRNYQQALALQGGVPPSIVSATSAALATQAVQPVNTNYTNYPSNPIIDALGPQAAVSAATTSSPVVTPSTASNAVTTSVTAPVAQTNAAASSLGPASNALINTAASATGASPSSTIYTTQAPVAAGGILADVTNEVSGLPSWALPAAAAVALFFLMKK